MAGRLSVGAVLTLRDEMSARLDRARGTAKQFVDQIHAGVSHLDKFTHSVTQTGAKLLQHFGESARAMVDKFFSTIKIGAGLAGAALGAMVFKGVEASMSFEAQIRHATGLLVASGASSDEADAAFKKFSEGILTMSPQLAKSPEDLAKSLYLPLSVMVQYGNVGASVEDTLKVVAAASKAATAGFADAPTVVTALSRVLGAYGASADQAAHYTDIMQQAVNYGLMTFSDLAQGIGKVAGPAAALHIPFEQVAAAIATITRRGILPDEAFTALNKFMLAVEKPHPEAIANLEAMFGPKWKDHFSATALAANGLSGVLDDLMGHVKPTKDQLAELSQATDFGTDEDIRAAGANILGSRVDQLIGVIGDVRGLRGVLALTATDGATSFATALGLTSDSVGAVDKQFNEYRKSTQFAKDQFTSFIDVLKESVFGGVLPGLGDRFRSMSAALAELTSSPIFQEADLGTKLKMIGSVILDALSGVPSLIGGAAAALWHGVTGWWNDHQDEVKKDIQDFFNWLGDVAIPWATEAATKLGAFLGPALLKSLAAVLSTPTGLATAGLLLGLKVVVPSVLSGAGGAAAAAEGGAALSGAAAELSGAAAALVSAAEALGGAATEEGVAAGAMTATAGAEATAAGVWASASWMQRLGSIALIAGSVYFTAKTYEDQKGTVEKAQGNLEDTTRGALDKGDLSSVAGGIKAARSNGGWAGDWSQSAAANLFGTDTPENAIMKQLNIYVTNKMTKAIQGLDANAPANLLGEFKSSGMWDTLSKVQQDSLQHVIDDTKQRIDVGIAKSQVESMASHGLSPFGYDSSWTPAQRQTDENFRASQDPAGFVKSVNEMVTQNLGAEPALRASADHFISMAETLQTSNPLLATFYRNMADTLIMMGNWVPPTFGPLVPSSDRGSINPGAISDSIGIGPDGTPYRKTPAGAPAEKRPMKGPYAAGGMGTVTRPTWFGPAGEAGAEDFAFVPHSKGGLAGLMGGKGVTVNGPLIGNAVIREEADVAKVAAALAYELEKAAGNANTGISG